MSRNVYSIFNISKTQYRSFFYSTVEQFIWGHQPCNNCQMVIPPKMYENSISQLNIENTIEHFDRHLMRCTCSLPHLSSPLIWGWAVRISNCPWKRKEASEMDALCPVSGRTDSVTTIGTLLFYNDATSTLGHRVTILNFNIIKSF